MTAERERFYRERDSRTESYLQTGSPARTPVSVHVSAEACETRAGQLAVVTLVNQLARIHREMRVALAVTNAELLLPALCGTRALGDEVATLVQRIDPFGRFDVGSPDLAPCAISIGIGEYCRRSLAWYLGWDSSNAYLDRKPCGLGKESSAALRGSGLAALLGASAVMKTALGMKTQPMVLSAWSLASDGAANPGPTELPEIDVGRGLMVGAGAVAAGVVYWLMQWGNRSSWTVIDHDAVALHNTNRTLLFFPDDAGWPDGNARTKVDCLCRHLPDVAPVRAWYDEAVEAGDTFDTVLVLANEREVRTLVSSRNDPIQFQATTGQSWLSQLHRHIAGRDDCVRCRMSDIRTPQLRCGEAAIRVDGTTATDAALPFLSAGAALMLASTLQRLQLGEFGADKMNRWSWDFASGHRTHTASYCECRDDCASVQGARARQMVASMTRWADSPWRRSRVWC